MRWKPNGRLSRRNGRHAVYEQTIVPHAVSHALLAEERGRHPAWVESAEPEADDEAARLIVDREQEEWENATLILCGSEFVRDGIASCGGPAERCAVVPYGTDPRFAEAVRPRPHGGPLRVQSEPPLKLAHTTEFAMCHG